MQEELLEHYVFYFGLFYLISFHKQTVGNEL